MKPKKPIKIQTHGICKNPECAIEFRKINTFMVFCSNLCMRTIVGYPDNKTPKSKMIAPRKPIPKMSEKRKKETAVYLKLRADFLNKDENKICPITGESTTDVHHMAGRTGSLYLDTRYWLAVSRRGHQKIELNPIWAKDNGYSLNRL